VRARQIFHFAPLNLALDAERAAASLFWAGEQLRLSTDATALSAPPRLTHHPRIDEHNRWSYSPQVSFPACGAKIEWRTRLVVEA
jgi:hypothetical protein